VACRHAHTRTHNGGRTAAVARSDIGYYIGGVRMDKVRHSVAIGCITPHAAPQPPCLPLRAVRQAFTAKVLSIALAACVLVGRECLMQAGLRRME
jgi:hypothetical protein